MAYKESVTIDDVLALLNELLEKDPSAIVSLVEHRVFCNKGIAEHPTVQVIEKDGVSYVGMLGILNGLFGVNEKNYGILAIELDDNLKWTKFIRLDKPSASSVDAGKNDDQRSGAGPELGQSPTAD